MPERRSETGDDPPADEDQEDTAPAAAPDDQRQSPEPQPEETQPAPLASPEQNAPSADAPPAPSSTPPTPQPSVSTTPEPGAGPDRAEGGDGKPVTPQPPRSAEISGPRDRGPLVMLYDAFVTDQGESSVRLRQILIGAFAVGFLTAAGFIGATWHSHNVASASASAVHRGPRPGLLEKVRRLLGR
ncbi:hypothetical protein JSY14_05265 [Brachybacterium sp. EF45031]|uniref:hypothetical protein n=1 Tax=Brachybacterium sillae TaxID=2810536 RepID=UPI00217EB38D|nr:hypothetical protein [Brachybacterium sillae]MCS6711461.1 hypothetical protein [Brachybacterium sillae]